MSLHDEGPLNVLDAHVHIHGCFDVSCLLRSASDNFRSEARRQGKNCQFTGILLLTETVKANWFQRLWSQAFDPTCVEEERVEGWRLCSTQEACSLTAQSNDNHRLVLLAGRQIVTRENLEVLALATTDTFPEGLPIRHILDTVTESGGVPVIPWGVGKWLGKRGRALKSLLTDNKTQRHFFLGDNGGRPAFWPRPHLLRIARQHGVRILSGTDPLPIASEASRPGSFGVTLRGVVSMEYPARDIKSLLKLDSTKLEPYGTLESPFRFFRNQISLRLQ